MAFRRLIAAGALAALGVMGVAPHVLAQAGGAGGTIGNQDKSLSGGEERTRTVPRARVEPRAAPARREARRPVARGNAFDGVWTSTAAGETCPGSVNGIATISNGHIIAQGVTGTVSRGGAVRMVVVGNGLTAVATGRMSGNMGAGHFKRSDGCIGRWSTVRQR